MDTIILAAGRNDRLKGAVPAYMKPLITVNGKSLIVSAVEDAIATSNRVIIVAAPHNVGMIIDVVKHAMPAARLHYVIQPDATGPLDAVRCAAHMLHDKNTMIICADNVIPRGTMQRLFSAMNEETDVVVPVTEMHVSDAERFTYFVGDDVFEKQEPPTTASYVKCWVGPLVVRTSFLLHALDNTDETLSSVIALADKLVLVETNCSDIGVPEALP